ncbi:hypothetical protein [Sulfuriferula sp. AH1]|uniref:hypothetical protein n=1 Tax=Sulfuriferula sp. AH1 TaxID=1985873 RepID=UPI0012F7D23A|nr:hypothetical protein [Sulfuriferula sp. AH1]
MTAQAMQELTPMHAGAVMTYPVGIFVFVRNHFVPVNSKEDISARNIRLVYVWNVHIDKKEIKHDQSLCRI